jgi:cysteinyl-tRNA synthetase
VSSFPEYGRLSRRHLDEQRAGARVAVDANKDAAEDFALWKLYDKGPLWDSPWGKGRPGWHIECSAMCYRELGETFDIHCGGEDLKFPHHENEIAQSCCAFPGSSFANYWIHTAFVIFSGEKMSKSLGNVVYLDDVLSPTITPEVVRYALLGTHYRKPVELHTQVLQEAREALNHIYGALEKPGAGAVDITDGPFWQCMLDDLNTPRAIAELHTMASAINTGGGDVARLRQSAQFLGLLNSTPEEWFHAGHDVAQVDALVEARTAARGRGDYVEADRIRQQLKGMGVEVMDGAGGSRWRSS